MATVAVVLWAAVWIGIAVVVAVDVFSLDRWSALLQSVAGSLDQAGRAVGSGGSLLAGTGVSGALRGLAGQARYSADAARGSIHQLAYLLGVSIGLIPTVPAVALYTHFRVSRRRERRALTEALCDPAERMAAVRYLAERAVDLGIADGPKGSVPAAGVPGLGLGMGADGAASPEDLRRLARAEAIRLGLGSEVAAAAGTDPR